VPPYDAPDERLHFVRAFLVSEGSLGIYGRALGSALPVPRSLLWLHPGHRVGPLRHDPEKLWSALATPLAPRDRVRLEFVQPYPPLVYLPQAVGVALARALGGGVGALFYAARVFNLAGFAACAWLALRLLPRRRWALLLLCLTPAAVSQAASLSPDAATNGVAFLLFALVVRAALGGERPLGRGAAAAILLACAALGWVKPGYWPLAGLVLAIPSPRFRAARRRWAFASGAFVATLVPALLWLLVVRGADPPPLRPNADPAAQLALVLGDPLGFAGVLLRTLWLQWIPWVAGTIGVLGQLDVALPLPLYALYPAALVAAAVADPADPPLLTAGRRWLAAGLFAAALLLMLSMSYLAYSDVGSPIVLDFQGRYFLPLAPLGMLVLPAGRERLGRLHPLWLGAFCGLVLAIALGAVWSHYY
jgi:uncharacterized membrane protein